MQATHPVERQAPIAKLAAMLGIIFRGAPASSAQLVGTHLAVSPAAVHAQMQEKQVTTHPVELEVQFAPLCVMPGIIFTVVFVL